MRSLRPALFAFCALYVLVPRLHAADDLISIAPLSYVGPGGMVEIPVYVQDVSGSPAGLDIGKSIRYLQFTLNFSRPELIRGCTNQTFPACNVGFRAAGVTAPNKPYAGNPITFVDSSSILVRRVYAGSISWTLDAPPPGDLIGYIQVTADSAAPPASEIAFDFLPVGTILGDQQLTVSETVGNGLRLSGGRVVVVDCGRAPVASELGFTWSGPFTGCSPESGGCQSGERIVFTPTSTLDSFGACETISWNFGDGSEPLSSATPVEHEFSPGTYDVAMTVTTSGGAVTIHRSITTTHPCMLPPAPAQMSVRYQGPTSTCSGFPSLCGTNESVHFTVTVPPVLAACTTFGWNFGDGTPVIVASAQINHAYANPGTYAFSVKVHTDGGETELEGLLKVGQQIACDANVPSSALVNDIVTFDAAFDIPGSTVFWFFPDDGTSSTAEDTQKAFSTSGVKRWHLLVSHDDFAWCQRSGVIDIQNPRRRTVRSGH